MSRRTPPPFAKQIRKARLLGAPLKNVSLHTGNGCWERAQTREVSDTTTTCHLVFPRNTEPSEFSWKCCSGLVVSILHAPQAWSVKYATEIDKETKKQVPVGIVLTIPFTAFGPDSIFPPVLELLAAEIVRAGARRVFLIDYKFPLRIFEPRAAA